MFSVLFTFSLPRLPLNVSMSSMSQLPCQQDFLKLNKTQKLESESSQKILDLTTPLISQINFFFLFLIWEHFLSSFCTSSPNRTRETTSQIQNFSHFIKETLKTPIYIFISSPRIWNFSNLKQKRRFDLGTISNFPNLKLLHLKGWEHFSLSLGFITQTIPKPIQNFSDLRKETLNPKLQPTFFFFIYFLSNQMEHSILRMSS